MENETSNFKNNKLSFKKLSDEKKAELLALQSGDGGEIFVFTKKLPLFYPILAALSLFWFAFLFYSSRDLMWAEWMFWLNAGITLLAAFALVFSLWKIAGGLFSKKRDGYIFTPDEFIKIEGDCVEVWNLKQLEAVQLKEEEGVLEVWQGTHEERVKFNDFADAQRLESLFDKWKLDSKENFASGCGEDKFGFKPAGKYATAGVLAIVAVLLGAGISYAARRSNANYDDQARWDLATRGGTIESFEEYLTRHPEGVHSAEAKEKISASLNKIKSEYEAKPKTKSLPEAVEAVNALLKNIVEDRRRTIYVKITEERNLDPAVITEMEERLYLSIEDYDYSAPAANEKYRKEKFFSDLGILFRTLTGNGAVKMEMTDNPPENEPSIEANYSINSAKIYYSYFSSLGGSRSITYYPGVEIVFNLNLNPGAGGKQFSITHTELPTSLPSNVYREEDAINYAFDKILFGKISGDFTKNLEQKFGFSE